MLYEVRWAGAIGQQVERLTEDRATAAEWFTEQAVLVRLGLAGWAELWEDGHLVEARDAGEAPGLVLHEGDRDLDPFEENP